MSTEVHEPATETTLAATHFSIGAHRGVEPRLGPVLAVHGFAQNRSCWGPLAAALIERCPVTLVDAPGHGDSAGLADASVTDAGDLVAATAGRWGEPVVFVGYSMGARMALAAALDHPGVVAGLVLIGATAGIADPGERRERRVRDDETAARLEALGLDRFLDEWLDMEMFAGLAPWARFDSERRTNTVEGLTASLTNAGTGSMTPMWDRLEQLEVPLLCITGADDERYGALAQRLVAAAGASPSVEHLQVADAGHAAHLERPDEVTDAVLGALERWSLQAPSR